MRVVLARANPASPSGYSYFTGSMEMVETEDGVAVVPSTEWEIAAGFGFPSPSAAMPILLLFRRLCPANTDWFWLTDREVAA